MEGEYGHGMRISILAAFVGSGVKTVEIAFINEDISVCSGSAPTGKCTLEER